MRFSFYCFLIFITLALTACQKANVRPIPKAQVSTASHSERSQIIQVVLESLKDPDSAKFGEAVLIDYGQAACIFVNAKNTYGGYTGYQNAILLNVTGYWDVYLIKNISMDHCISAAHRTLNNSGFLDTATPTRNHPAVSNSSSEAELECLRKTGNSSCNLTLQKTNVTSENELECLKKTGNSSCTLHKQ